MADNAEAIAINPTWLRARPLPVHGEGTDKNNRGHVVAIGGSRSVPGGLLLTGEAALRAGAGKVQLATVERCGRSLGIALPEAGVIALGENDGGEIDADRIGSLPDSLERCDSVVVGPAMTSTEAAGALVDALLAGLLDSQAVLIDAVALHSLREREDRLRGYRGPLIVTPNPDELESILDCGEEQIERDPAACAREAAARLGAVTVCKGSETYIATPQGELLRYSGGGVGLATGGSGDVLAGIIAGLAARGSESLVAAAWGVWLHGEAGRRLSASVGPVGFLARELPPLVPELMHSAF